MQIQMLLLYGGIRQSDGEAYRNILLMFRNQINMALGI